MKCDHRVCAGCTCPCHRRPKAPPLAAVTPNEATAQAVELKHAALQAIRLLTALTATTKTQPRSQLEQAIIRGNADLDTALKSPTLNGAVTGGDDPSWRMLDQITTREILDADGNVVSGGDLIDRSDAIGTALAELVTAITDIGGRAASAYSAVEDLRGLTPVQAERLLEADSDVQACVNCGRIVTGTRDDRLKAGRCGPCYEYRHDHDGQDRPKHLIQREIDARLGGTDATP